MNAKRKSGMVIGVLLLMGALCVHGWIALDLAGQKTLFLGEGSRAEKVESHEVTSGGTDSMQLKIKLGFDPAPKESQPQSLAYTVPFTYTVRTTDGSDIVKREVVLERNPLGEFARDESPALYDTHLLPVFRVPTGKKLHIICAPGSFSARELKLDSFRVSLVEDPVECQNRLFWIFGLVLSGGLVLLVNCDIPPLNVGFGMFRKIRRSPAIGWIITFFTVGLYGPFWLVFLGHDVERLTGKRTVKYDVSWGVMTLIWVAWFLSVFGPVPKTIYGKWGILLPVVAITYFAVLVLKVTRVLREECDVELPSSFLMVVLSVIWMFSLPLLQWRVNQVREQEENKGKTQ